jgi:hypothetical protein
MTGRSPSGAKEYLDPRPEDHEGAGIPPIVRTPVLMLDEPARHQDRLNRDWRFVPAGRPTGRWWS